VATFTCCSYSYVGSLHVIKVTFASDCWPEVRSYLVKSNKEDIIGA